MFITPLKDFKLKFEYKEDGVKWYSLKKDLIWQSSYGTFKVPHEIFMTDVASIPTFFQRWFKPLGKYSRSSVLHDYIVEEKHLSYFRKHFEYLKAMREDKVNIFKAWGFFISVYSFFWLHRLINK